MLLYPYLKSNLVIALYILHTENCLTFIKVLAILLFKNIIFKDLLEAAKNGRIDEVKLLLDQGVNIEAKMENGKYFLLWKGTIQKLNKQSIYLSL